MRRGLPKPAPRTPAQQQYFCARGQHADEIPTEHEWPGGRMVNGVFTPWGVRMVWKCPHCGAVRGRVR